MKPGQECVGREKEKVTHHLSAIIPGQELCICYFISQWNLFERWGNGDSVVIRNLHKIIQIEKLTHLKRPRCWERLKAGGEADDRGWDGWVASLTQWTWLWVSSKSWWCTGKPEVHGVAKSQTRLSHRTATIQIENMRTGRSTWVCLL